MRPTRIMILNNRLRNSDDNNAPTNITMQMTKARTLICSQTRESISESVVTGNMDVGPLATSRLNERAARKGTSFSPMASTVKAPNARTDTTRVNRLFSRRERMSVIEFYHWGYNIKYPPYD